MKRTLVALGTVSGLVLAGYLLVISLRIKRQSTHDEAHRADVIVVLGAAEYSGRPSPVFKARLDHALSLYRKGLAAHILTTGGAGGDPHFTEGDVGRAYLILRGVPSEAILVEPEGSSTVHSLTAAFEIMNRMGMRSCIVVSDGYHIYRVKKLLESRGLRVYGSPRPSEAPADLRAWWLYLRQSVGYLLWSIGVPV
ncbi:MAG: YdcF family protein [Bryobacterales bacterium]|nr:YdcF family protein [Bryobacterales bacterium]